MKKVLLTRIKIIVKVVTTAFFMSKPPRINVTAKTEPNEMAKLMAVSSTIVKYCS